MTLLLSFVLTWSPIAPRAVISPPAVVRVLAVRPVSVPDTSERASISGIASWGRGWEGVVTRLPRGTWITVTGPRGTWSGRSVGYGPAMWTGRIADLSASVFREVCGPLAMGLCEVVLSW